MFNLSGSEIVFLLLLALIVLGPEKLPEAVRKFGKAYAEFKKMSTGFQSELKTALDEPMREMRETAEAFKNAVNFDFEDGEPEDDESAAVEEVSDEPTAEPLPAEVLPAEVLPAEEAAGELEAGESATEPETAGNEPPLVRPPGPTFHSAAPQKPEVVEAVEETASE
jgi:sec-independent protein translocase protein TatB